MAEPTERPVAVTFALGPDDRSQLEARLGPGARLEVVEGLPDDERRAALERAEALLVWLWRREVRPEELDALGGVRLIQLVTAGADSLPFEQVPEGATVAGNVGAYAEPMAEHVVAMVLAVYKRLPERHEEMAAGTFNSFMPARMLGGTAWGVLGYGGIGRAVARLLRPFGVEIHAVNTSGRTDDEVAFAGTLDDLDAVLAVANVLVVSLPLTNRTRGLIGARELGLMKPDAILVNVARGAIVDETALYEHLVATPSFTAALDAWWREPLGPGGEFRTEHPFFELPNVLGSPHNSAVAEGVIPEAVRRAADNVGRWLRGEPVTGVMDPADYA